MRRDHHRSGWLRKASCHLLLSVGLLGCCSCAARAQEIQLGDAAPATHRQHVEMLTSHVEVPGRQRTWVELHFRVDPGMHINSHAPHDETLIPTLLHWEPSSTVKVLDEQYPAGVPLRLEIGSGETLSTYQGEFAVRLQFLAPEGSHTLNGSLRYQACDARSCFPPRTLPLQMTISAH